MQTKGELTPRGQGQEHLAGMNEPVSSSHRSGPTAAPSFSSYTQRRLILLLLLPLVGFWDLLT